MENLAEQPTKENFVDWEQLEAQLEPQPLLDDEKFLTEVDHLNANRLPNGEHSQWVLDEQLKNLLSATQEAGMPYAVSKTKHVYQEAAEYDEEGRKVGAFMWLGKTAVENAMSGYRYHRHPEALKRVDVEVDEARDSINLTPGMTKIFISPRMTRKDASLKEAKAEHLANEDSVRTSEAIVDAHGNITERAMESLLFRDIPLEAWVDFLGDSSNIFGKAINVENNGSALPVMMAHGQLEVKSDKLENGILSIVEAVTPYIKDPELRAGAKAQLERFREDQEAMLAKAENIARRWQKFEIDLADSLKDKRATPAIKGFINSMQTKWGSEDLSVILDHQLSDGEYTMSRKLAPILEKAKQNFLWTRAGVVTGNEKVLEQLDKETANQLYRDEMVIQVATDSGDYARVMTLDAQTDRVIANNNVGVGGGCPGESNPTFNSDNPLESSGMGTSILSSSFSLEAKVGKISRGKCVVESCPTRPGEVKVGGCGVCLERCQKLFDKGKDPTKMRIAKPRRPEGGSSNRQTARQEIGHKAVEGAFKRAVAV
jgi:hypothetical protein